MADVFDNLERELDRELGRWAGRLDVRPDGPCVESVRTAVGCELGEMLLTAHSSPLPSPAVIKRVRAAVAAELRVAPGAERKLRVSDPVVTRGSWSRRWVSSQGWASLGAAAMLLLCVGVIWYASTLGRPTAGSAETELFATAMPNSPIDPIQTEVQSLETQLPEDEAFPRENGESLGDLVREMDRLIEKRDPARGTSRIEVEGVGVLG